MKEIKLTIPEGCKTVTMKVDGEQVITEFEPKEEKFEPKDGDILFGIVWGVKSIIIFNGVNDSGGVLAYAGLIYGFGKSQLFVDKKPGNGYGMFHNYTRYATEDEKKLLFDALAKEGKRWCAEKKQIEDFPRWRAEEGKEYFYVTFRGTVKECTDNRLVSDNECYSIGNYFKTREAAERVAEQIREIFKNSKAE